SLFPLADRRGTQDRLHAGARRRGREGGHQPTKGCTTMNLDREALDRHITGNYGEDQFVTDSLTERAAAALAAVRDRQAEEDAARRAAQRRSEEERQAKARAAFHERLKERLGVEADPNLDTVEVDGLRLGRWRHGRSGDIFLLAACDGCGGPLSCGI